MHGIIRFDTIPKNAKISIDNQYIGKTPLDIKDVESNIYKYKITLDKYSDYINNAIVKENKILHITIDLKNKTKTEEYNDLNIKLNSNKIESLSPFSNDKKKNVFEGQLYPVSPIDNSIQQQILEQLILLNEKTGSTAIEPLYYDVSNTITNTTLVAPDTADDPAYDREQIFNLIDRNSKKLTVTNDGNGNIFVRISHDGITFSEEIPIYESDVKTYYDIREIRLRADRAGCRYRITEYPLANVTVNIQKSEKIYSLSTDKDTDFISALNMNYMETVHFDNQLISNRIKIIAVNGQSMQPLKYRLIFWGSHSTQNTTDLDSDTFLTDIVMDFSDPLSTFQIDTGAGLVNQYYLDVSALEGLYDCYDDDYSMHVSLQNMSPIAKLADAAGAVQFDIKYGLRL